MASIYDWLVPTKPWHHPWNDRYKDWSLHHHDIHRIWPPIRTDDEIIWFLWFHGSFKLAHTHLVLTINVVVVHHGNADFSVLWYGSLYSQCLEIIPLFLSPYPQVVLVIANTRDTIASICHYHILQYISGLNFDFYSCIYYLPSCKHNKDVANIFTYVHIYIYIHIMFLVKLSGFHTFLHVSPRVITIFHRLHHHVPACFMG